MSTINHSAERSPEETHVLVVDDEDDVRETLCHLISANGYAVTGVGGGEEALSVLLSQTTPVDLVLTDLQMPGMNGWQLLHSIHQHNADLPVVVITGFISEEGVSILTDREVAGYLVKPINTERLRILFKALLHPNNLGRSSEVVVIDDDRGTLAMVERALADRGIFYHCFDNAQEGLQQIRKSSPDLAIIDLSLEKVDGFDVCQELRASPDTASLPILILTASPSRQNVFRAIELNVAGFVAKPFVMGDLGEIVVRALRQAGG
jgi:DNA-binding response OmpR family regulator